MPVKRCNSGGKSGWKWGDKGKCYTGPGAKKKAIKQGVAIEAPLIQQGLDEVHEAKTVQEARSALYSAKTCVGLSVSYKNNELKKQALDMLQAAIDNLPEDSEATKMQLHEWKPRMERTLRLVPVPF